MKKKVPLLGRFSCIPIKPTVRTLISIHTLHTGGEWQLTISVSRKMVECDALAEVNSTVVKGLPIQAKLQVVCQVHAYVSACSDGPKGRAQLLIMDPYFNVFSVEENVQATSVVKM